MSDRLWLNPPRALADVFEGVGGALKRAPEDFVVDEEAAYAPSGEGPHLYLRVGKRGLTTPQVVSGLAQAFEVSPRDVGSAGLKDRHAVTSQWLSVLVEGRAPEAIDEALARFAAQGPDAWVIERSRHRNKLKTGHLRGNRFTVRARGARVEDAAALAAATQRLAAYGFINYFGRQRFGRDGDNAERGVALMTRRRARGRRGRLLVSAAQSAVFNVYAARRQAAGTLRRVAPGDALQRRETGGVFVCEDAVEDQARLEAGELVITGPLPGRKAWGVTGAPAAWEAAAAAEVGLSDEALAGAGKLAPGARRPLLVWPEGLEVTHDEAGVVARFTLPAGCYATVLLRELMGDHAETTPDEVGEAGEDADEAS